MNTELYLRVDHYQRSRDTHIPLDSATLEESLDEEDRLEVEIPRSEWYDLRDRIDDNNDEFFLRVGGVDDEGDDAFGGRLVEIDRGGVSVTLDIRSFEEDARTAEPTGGALVFENARDADVVVDALDRVPSLSPGTVEAVDTTVSYLFSHSSPAKMIRHASQTTAAEVKYNPDKTVDYVRRLGHDREIELSPSNRTISTEFQAVETANERVTHILAIGAGEGDHQLTVRIADGDWDDRGSRPVWKRINFKDISDPDHLETLAQQYFAEYNATERAIEVDLDIDGIGVEIGDTFPLTYSREEIFEERLRVIDLVTHITEAGVTYSARLSNRRLTVEKPDMDVRSDIDNYRSAFEGNAVPMSESGGRQPVEPGNPYEMSVYQPSDVVQELDSKLQIKGRPYRAYSRGTAAGGGEIVTETSASNDDFENVVEVSERVTRETDVTSSWRSITNYTVSNNTSMMLVHVNLNQALPGTYPEFGLDEDDWMDATRAYSVRLANTTDGVYHPDSEGERMRIGGRFNQGAVFLDGSNLNGKRLELQMRYEGDLSAHRLINVYRTWIGLGQHTHELEIDIPDHDHDPEPGIIEFDRFPSECDIIINGNEMGVSLGDGSREFVEEVDISNYLRPGFNDIEITSEELGMLDVTASRDLYRQILGRDT